MQSGHTWIQNQEGSILHLGPRSVVPPQQTSYLLDLASIPSPLPWAHLGHPSYLQQTLFILQVQMADEGIYYCALRYTEVGNP